MLIINLSSLFVQLSNLKVNDVPNLLLSLALIYSELIFFFITISDTEEELKNLDSYEKPIVEELNSIINSDTLNKIQNIHDSIQESVNIWKEMHFKKYISSERVVNGNNYEYYDKLYQEFYEQL